MRRGSIVGPIILILIGLLFLANNLRPDVPMLEFLGQYWPFLLIGWGLVRLVEILIWAVRGNLCPRRVFRAASGRWLYFSRFSAADCMPFIRESDGGDLPDFGCTASRCSAKLSITPLMSRRSRPERILGSFSRIFEETCGSPAEIPPKFA